MTTHSPEQFSAIKNSWFLQLRAVIQAQRQQSIPTPSQYNRHIWLGLVSLWNCICFMPCNENIFSVITGKLFVSCKYEKQQNVMQHTKKMLGQRQNETEKVTGYACGDHPPLHYPWVSDEAELNYQLTVVNWLTKLVNTWSHRWYGCFDDAFMK